MGVALRPSLFAPRPSPLADGRPYFPSNALGYL